ncbi:hypothetical protein [Pseudomonas syringae group genomosp. 3]|uniref:hypothetical protein n=1 Tax=Pseudomonas syringae group genomosp. 3 TaxID=251701 RepID=UPI0006E5F780|nr:hypothetical protein [Pseudomonas syringae group genomosp. 3]KPW52543.1 Unknown protein sequence [Pseudomonas syringae pv. berberidis]RMP58826.1 hypothetical protein ALQ19_02001 [Pseudomonas syringae pv. berberidis]
MLDFFQSIWGAFLIGIGAFLGVCKVFENYEKVIKKDKLQRITENITKFRFSSGARKIFALWIYLNNAVFGKKIISLRAFLVSVILTNIWAAIFIMVFSVKYPMFREWVVNILYVRSLHWPALVIYASVLVLEFLSISLSRKIYRVALSRGNKVFGWSLLIDFFGSVLVYYVGLTLVKVVLLHQSTLSLFGALKTWLNPSNLTTLLMVVEDFDMSNFKPNGHGRFTTEIPLTTEVVYAFPEGVFFFTSLLTSVWLWGYIAAYGLAYACVRIDRLPPKLWNFLKIEEQPLLSLSVFFGTIGVFVYVLAHLAKMFLGVH